MAGPPHGDGPLDTCTHAHLHPHTRTHHRCISRWSAGGSSGGQLRLGLRVTAGMLRVASRRCPASSRPPPRPRSVCPHRDCLTWRQAHGSIHGSVVAATVELFFGQRPLCPPLCHPMCHRLRPCISSASCWLAPVPLLLVGCGRRRSASDVHSTTPHSAPWFSSPHVLLDAWLPVARGVRSASGRPFDHPPLRSVVLIPTQV